MTAFEFFLCILAVFSSSASQLFIKLASQHPLSTQGLLALSAGGLLMLFSMLVFVWILRSFQLSQVVPFAGGAYVLVPIGSSLFFKDQLRPRFWIGVTLILIGIYLTIG